MLRRMIAAASAVALLALPATAAEKGNSLHYELQTAINNYLAKRQDPEHISTVSATISPKATAQDINIVAGQTEYGGSESGFEGKGDPVTPAYLFQIGSNTKAFTSVAILRLEAAGKLTIDDTLGKWLPQYPAWKGVTIRRLLSMTSPIPGYDNQDSILRTMASHPDHVFNPQELVAAVYPRDGHGPKPVSGWTYSNTNYILAQMIIEKASGKSYSDVVGGLFDQIGLKSTYYQQNKYPASITKRMVSGYFFNHDADSKLLAPLLAKDTKNFGVSWMQAAGGIVGKPQDVAHWSRALFEGSLLETKQRRELMTLVSCKTGHPIAKTNAADPLAFGLGIAQATRPGIGTFWYYQGETLGYRVMYGWFPASDAMIAIGANSQPDSAQNKLGDLVENVYNILHQFKLV